MSNVHTSRPVTAERVDIVADQSDWMTAGRGESTGNVGKQGIRTALEAELSLQYIVHRLVVVASVGIVDEV
jgi:hypothetical protein